MKIENYITDKLNYPMDFFPAFVRFKGERGETIAFGLGSTRDGERFSRYFRKGRNGEILRTLIEHGLQNSTSLDLDLLEEEFSELLFLEEISRYETPSVGGCKYPRGCPFVPEIFIPDGQNLLDVARTTWRSELDLALWLVEILRSCSPSDSFRFQLRIATKANIFEICINYLSGSWEISRTENPSLILPGNCAVLFRNSEPVGAVKLSYGPVLNSFFSYFVASSAASIFEMKRCFEWVCKGNFHEVEEICSFEGSENYPCTPTRRVILWEVD